MAEVIPFRGILYNVSQVSGEDVVAPPYDIITPEYREQLYNKSPYNIVRIDSGKELEGDNESENKYTRAAYHLNSWLDGGILVRAQNQGFYVYEVDYTIEGQQKKLRGFFGVARLEELGKGNIYPHECTHPRPKVDRLNLMRACNANVSPIFSLYNNPERKVSEVLEGLTPLRQPYMEARDYDGAVHRLWIIEDKEDIETLRNDLKGRAIFIADGHHRYETALEFQREMQEKNPSYTGDEPFNYVLMFLANISDGGLTILPTHRLIKSIPENTMDSLSRYFEVEAVPSGKDIAGIIAGTEHAFGFCQQGNGHQYILRYRGDDLSDVHPALRELDVMILHELIFKKILGVADIAYEMDVRETINKVKDGHYGAAFFLNPTKVEDVERVALASMRMPPKSTYFYPKLLTGFVINSFNEIIIGHCSLTKKFAMLSEMNYNSI